MATKARKATAAQGGSSAYVTVDMNSTLGVRGFGQYGPGKDVVVPRRFAELTGLEIKADAERPEETMTPEARAQAEGSQKTSRGGRRASGASKSGAKGGQGDDGAQGGDNDDGKGADPSKAPETWPETAEEIDQYNADVVKAEYDRRVEAGEVEALESGKGSGADGAFVKGDYVRALAKK